MKAGLLAVLFLGVTIAGSFGGFGAAEAQSEKRRHLGAYRDWDAFVYTYPNGQKTCHMISSPKSSQASRRNANRGDIYIMVSHRPEYGVTGEVNVVVGYPIRQGSDAVLAVDGRSRFEYFTEGSGAWAYDPTDDAKTIAAMRRGNRLVVNATSQRGTNTTDSYSLSGFTAAYNAITAACR